MKKEFKVGEYSGSVEVLFGLPKDMQYPQVFNGGSRKENAVGIYVTFCGMPQNVLWYEVGDNIGLIADEIAKHEEKLIFRLEEANKCGGSLEVILSERGYKF